MKDSVFVLMNMGGIRSSNSRKEIYQFIEDDTRVQESFEFKPDKGKLVASGGDFAFFIDSIGTIATLIDLLWRVYDKFVKNEMKKGDPLSHPIEIVVGNASIRMDNYYHDREDFANKISFQVTQTKTKITVNMELRNIVLSEHWKKRKIIRSSPK